MTQDNTCKSYLTIKQFVEKHPFTSVEGLRWKIYSNADFRKKCTRKFGKKILIIEEKVLEYIENSK